MDIRCFPSLVFLFLLFPRLTDPAFAGSVSSYLTAAEPAEKPAIDESLYSGMKWRVGCSFRGGRAFAGPGVVRERHTSYFVAGPTVSWESSSDGTNAVCLFPMEAD